MDKERFNNLVRYLSSDMEDTVQVGFALLNSIDETTRYKMLALEKAEFEIDTSKGEIKWLVSNRYMVKDGKYILIHIKAAKYRDPY